MPSKKHDSSPIFFIINGAPGVGKSTLAQALSVRLDIRQRSDTRSLLAVYRTLTPNNPALKPIRPLVLSSAEKIQKHLLKRSNLIAPAENKIIDRNSRSIPFILDGTCLLKRFLKTNNRCLFITLAAPPTNTYRQWLYAPQSRSRPVYFPISLANTINKSLIDEAKASKTPIIEEVRLNDRVKHVLRLLHKHK